MIFKAINKRLPSKVLYSRFFIKKEQIPIYNSLKNTGFPENSIFLRQCSYMTLFLFHFKFAICLLIKVWKNYFLHRAYDLSSICFMTLSVFGYSGHKIREGNWQCYYSYEFKYKKDLNHRPWGDYFIPRNLKKDIGVSLQSF